MKSTLLARVLGQDDPAEVTPRMVRPGFTFGLNTSTIRPASLTDKIEIAAKAGFDAVELWIGDVKQAVESGTPLKEIDKRLDDHGLARPSMIAVWGWCEADDATFARNLDKTLADLETARAIGVKRIVASPPGGEVDLALATDRYATLLEASVEMGVPASVEFLGFVEGINTLEKAWKIAAGTASAEATVTPDVWHMFRGGSDVAALEAIPPDHISCFHWNDAPAKPARTEQTDADRVYPGDGVYDIARIAKILKAKDFRGCLTLELFNRDYWKRDLLEVARTGLAKMKASVAQG